MVTRRPPVAAAGTADDVEAQFYEALQQADLEALMRLWADDDDIVCVHPGGPRLVGLAAIRASFEAIFANGRIPVVPEQVHRVTMMGGALHHLVERIEVAGEGGATHTAYVLATNVYVKTPQGWRIAAHHASPGTLNEVSSVGDAPATLH
jgi:uncharacterized protein (TIGR02246 family)